MKSVSVLFTISLLFCSAISYASMEGSTTTDNEVSQQEGKTDGIEHVEDYRDSEQYQNEFEQDYAVNVDSAEPDDQVQTESVSAPEVLEESNSFLQAKLPGEEINFKLKLHKTNLHFVEGRASSDIGKVLFKSRLMPSNEVKLSLTMKQREVDDVQLVGYFDLANFTMELDGSNAVLNKDHKELIHVLNQHLRSQFEVAYRDYDFPEHAFMLVQMLSYWAVSPEGYVHEKREIVANY